MQRHGVVTVLSQRNKQLVGIFLPVYKHEHLPFVAPLPQKAQKAPKLGVCGHDLDHVINCVADDTPTAV